MTNGAATTPARTYRSVTWTEPLRLFRTRLSDEPFNPSRPLTHFNDGEVARSFALQHLVGSNHLQEAFTNTLLTVTRPNARRNNRDRFQ